MKSKDVFLYKLIRPIITIFVKIVYRPKIIGIKNIPKTGKIILAGNHTSILDSILLISSTKRNIHFLAKKELFTGLKKILFSNLGLIPVDRSIKDNSVLPAAKSYLDNNCVIGIFPEGTTEKGIKKLLPFKIGAVKLSYETNTKIIPFKIIGEYKPFKRNVKIIFKESYKANENLDKSNKELFKIIDNIKDCE